MTEHDRGAWPWAVWGGLAIVGLAAAVLSFSALADLARIVGITGRLFAGESGEGGFPLAWLLPLAVDVFAVTATIIWLLRRVAAEAIAFARRSAWTAIAATVVGNAYHGALVESADPPPWFAVVAVSALPAVALGALVHLAVLVGRPADGDAAEPGVESPWLGLLDQVLAEPWDHAVAAWSGPVGKPRVDRNANDEAIAADLRRLWADRPRPVPRDTVVDLYRVGAGRAGRIRELVDELAGADQ